MHGTALFKPNAGSSYDAQRKLDLAGWAANLGSVVCWQKQVQDAGEMPYRGFGSDTLYEVKICLFAV